MEMLPVPKLSDCCSTRRHSRIKMVKNVGELKKVLECLSDDCSVVSGDMSTMINVSIIEDDGVHLNIAGTMGPPNPHSTYMDGAYWKEEFLDI